MGQSEEQGLAGTALLGLAADIKLSCGRKHLPQASVRVEGGCPAVLNGHAASYPLVKSVRQRCFGLILLHAYQVYTTCSTEAKRRALLARFPALSPGHIADSRSCAFEAAVLRGTGGRGVHLVLNSLAGDKLQARSRLGRCAKHQWLAEDLMSLCWISGCLLRPAMGMLC